jgi:hypothetical protein
MIGNIVYLQADARFNDFLFNPIKNQSVICYVAEKCNDLNVKRVVWGRPSENLP